MQLSRKTLVFFLLFQGNSETGSSDSSSSCETLDDDLDNPEMASIGKRYALKIYHYLILVTDRV